MDQVNEMTSSDFVSLIIQYNGDLAVFERYPGLTYTDINSFQAALHVPIQGLAGTIIRRYGTSSLPRCYGIIDTTNLESSGVTRIQNVPNFSTKGQGVLIGIVDTGIEYTNQVFRNADNTTKILSIWDQTIESNGTFPEDNSFGTIYTREQINIAVLSENPLEIVPSTDENGHGTMLAGLIAGSPIVNEDFVGIVPNAELLVVKLREANPFLKEFFRIPDSALCFEETDIMFGVKYLIENARRLQRPIVICIGLGSSQGSHTGRGPLDIYLGYLGDVAGTIIVTGAGNEGAARGHYNGTIDTNLGYDTVELNVGANEAGFTMEFWGSSPGLFSIDILSPNGEYIPRIPPRLGESRVITFVFERTIIYVDFQIIGTMTGEELILIRFSNPSEGVWRFRVYGSGDLSNSFNIWLPMRHFIGKETYFLDSDQYITLTSPSNNVIPIVATAYNHLDQSLYVEASRGFTRANDVKPDLAAPGVEVFSPWLNNTFIRSSGTSVAAAQLAGISAMLLEWGILRGNATAMDSIEARNILARGARRNPNLTYPNRDWGYGIVDIYNAFITLRGEY
ncbi:MAG: S8 family peptidase [Clostridiales bacterium]|nr:S8 family peptidase [Clostridiales bacterium]